MTYTEKEENILKICFPLPRNSTFKKEKPKIELPFRAHLGSLVTFQCRAQGLDQYAQY